MSSIKALTLYKQMLRESQRFKDFNFRKYAFRRVRDGFKMGKDLREEEARKQIQFAQSQLELIRRQNTIGHLFHPGNKLSVEAKSK